MTKIILTGILLILNNFSLAADNDDFYDSWKIEELYKNGIQVSMQVLQPIHFRTNKDGSLQLSNACSLILHEDYKDKLTALTTDTIIFDKAESGSTAEASGNPTFAPIFLQPVRKDRFIRLEIRKENATEAISVKKLKEKCGSSRITFEIGPRPGDFWIDAQDQDSSSVVL